MSKTVLDSHKVPHMRGLGWLNLNQKFSQQLSIVWTATLQASDVEMELPLTNPISETSKESWRSLLIETVVDQRQLCVS